MVGIGFFSKEIFRASERPVFSLKKASKDFIIRQTVIAIRGHCERFRSPEVLPERKYSVWIGGSILASLSTFQLNGAVGYDTNNKHGGLLLTTPFY